MIESLDTPYIHVGTDKNYKTLVLENSNTGPVLLNFWSKKAGPCLRQYPILDKVIHHYKGGMLLINVDVDKEIIVTKEYGIASVPTLKLLRQQEVLETLFGYQSETDLRQCLGKYVSSQSDQALSQAIGKYTEGDTSEALEIIANAIVADPDNIKLPTALCKILMRESRFSDAEKLVNSLPDSVRNSETMRQLQDNLQSQLNSDND